ncbi:MULTISPECIES: VOC family protein [unclassified Burkholderia]|uniref:VOC family protein n=1 Tax=unclassified Burkholderia TaxID=2613784 RepID=UPI000F580F19|nr:MULTISPECIES: VOC family protein [unclassified Burkholderia]RQR70956.1 glyoxalase [Burkholderia sp. Bp9011]RQR83719.1 glyoxalase [Burkholderia sp. Bp9010]RQS64420.1 glyoxalase [Burkholderia sp. Bp8977]
MRILGPDTLVFGVDDVESCTTFLTDYGLIPKGNGAFDALDGTGVIVRPKNDPLLPPWPFATANQLRKTIYGVADQAALDEIARELATDREVKHLANGSIEAVDDAGFTLGFQVSVRTAPTLPAETVNAPGDTRRPVNVPGSPTRNDEQLPLPRTLSHVVYFVPDAEKAEAFYVERLGFRVSDRFVGMGPFLRPAGTLDHHTLFLIQTPPAMQGCDHFTFHLGGPSEVLRAGYAFASKGYETFWGPGRHRFGSNWFWYFNSPLGCHVEYDADMDQHDDTWVPRVAPAMVDNAQEFLFQWREKWAPGGPPPAAGDAPH